MRKETVELLKILSVALGTILIILILTALFNRHLEPEKQKIQPTISPSRELRGVWMSRFDYTQNLGTTQKEIIQQYIDKSFKSVKEANCNTIFFQVRGNGDAFYKSSYEPWSHLLTGTLGKDPGWDPLEFAVITANKYNLELHAWINTFPCWRGTQDPIKTTPLQPYSAHPDWLVCDSNGVAMPKSDHYVSFSPGNPDARRHIRNVVMEICSKYDIDGIHFDYIRYPEGSTTKGYSHDAVSVDRFNSRRSNPLKLDWADWQREQVTTFIAEAYNAITSVDPSIKVSAAVLGNYNMPGWNGYNKVYQDAARWAEIGKIDMIVPMTYSSRKNGRFQSMIKLWKSLQNIDRPITPGLGVWTLPFSEILEEIDDVRNTGLSGVVLFAMSSLDSARWDSLKNERFQYPAIPPALPWKFREDVPVPENCSLSFMNEKLVFNWQTKALKNRGNFIRNYIIYSSQSDSVDTTDGSSIFAIIPGNTEQYIIEKDTFTDKQHFFISALDAANNESRISKFSTEVETMESEK
ncbi:MAG: hypothetical protein DRP96_05830 [Candidatus Neomarinimicrobiota bacterium]|nr:MAG: hypothetical protein DRP96_05830 [Candidatus Neomarinimicrobiota bacterium]